MNKGTGPSVVHELMRMNGHSPEVTRSDTPLTLDDFEPVSESKLLDRLPASQRKTAREQIDRLLRHDVLQRVSDGTGANLQLTPFGLQSVNSSRGYLTRMV